MYREKKLTLEDEYCLWLEENCKCDESEDDCCCCIDFEDWFNDKMDALSYNYDNEMPA